MAIEAEAEARILGGLPVIVVGRIHRAERDVGLMNDYCDVDDICWQSGASIPTSMWQRLSSDDYERCREALLESVS